MLKVARLPGGLQTKWEDARHFSLMRGVQFRPRKVLEFSITCWIYFTDALLAQSPISNLDQNCAFEKIALLDHSKGLNVHFRSEFEVTLDQKCICEANPTRDTGLLRTLFWTKNLTFMYRISIALISLPL